MKLKVINSNSKGNCYILESKESCLLIEAGVTFSEINKALDFEPSKVDLLVCTHEHL